MIFRSLSCGRINIFRIDRIAKTTRMRTAG
jgi:hypothetical protein